MDKIWHRGVIRYLQKVGLTTKEIHADMVSTLGDDARRTIDAITICYFNHSTLLIFASKLSVRFGYLFIIV